MKSKVSITLEDSLIKAIDGFVDNITIRNRSQAIESLVRNAMGKNKAAVILAGGDAKKLRISPEEYRPTAGISGSTVIETSILKLHDSGFRNIYIIGRKELLTAIFSILKNGSEHGVTINYIEEKKSLGTYKSLKLLRGMIHNTFLVVYCDIIFSNINLNEIWNTHLKENTVATLLLTTSPKASEKGTVAMEGNTIVDFSQKPKRVSTYLVFSSLFIAEPGILEYDGESLEYDLFPELAKKKLVKGHISPENVFHIHSKKDAEKWK
ncbi:MAG: sugar phosphate nucleotidyltransferase [Candidatus Woesearchaeota archaeon]